MSRNGTSAIHESTYYLGIVYAKLATEWKLWGVLTGILPKNLGTLGKSLQTI
jgi:hypothetical protein